MVLLYKYCMGWWSFHIGFTVSWIIFKLKTRLDSYFSIQKNIIYTLFIILKVIFCFYRNIRVVILYNSQANTKANREEDSKYE